MFPYQTVQQFLTRCHVSILGPVLFNSPFYDQGNLGTEMTLVKSAPDAGMDEVSSPLERDRIISKTYQTAEKVWNKEDAINKVQSSAFR